MLKKSVFFFAGPIVFFIVRSLNLEGLSLEGEAVLATSCWVAIWWITEVVELEVTSLMPIILLPLSGGVDINATTTSYTHPYIFLFMGGFIIGLAIEKCGLHRRIAFKIISFIGSSERRVILGFMIATAFLSMWISNTATSIMMLPIGISVIHQFGDEKSFSRSLMLGIGYAASIGGMATLIGTPPNIIFAGVISDSLNAEVAFFDWMIFALPFSVVLLIITWYYLTYSNNRSNKRKMKEMDLGMISTPEKRVLMVFIFTAFLWISRSFLLSQIIPEINDTIIAMFGALLLFVIPSGDGNDKLMNWKTAKKLPWGVLLIFGAGLAIAKGFADTDLATWLANQFLELKAVPFFLILILVIAGINFLTEITSNTATASMILPILISLASSLEVSPYLLMAGAVLASSCAFMLPVATPPNAVVFSSGRIKIGEMVTTGVWINLISIVLIFLFVSYWWGVVF